jgi:hypothetical protein
MATQGEKKFINFAAKTRFEFLEEQPIRKFELISMELSMIHCENDLKIITYLKAHYQKTFKQVLEHARVGGKLL